MTVSVDQELGEVPGNHPSGSSLGVVQLAVVSEIDEHRMCV